MGQISMEKPSLPGSTLSGNQHRRRIDDLAPVRRKGHPIRGEIIGRGPWGGHGRQPSRWTKRQTSRSEPGARLAYAEGTLLVFGLHTENVGEAPRRLGLPAHHGRQLLRSFGDDDNVNLQAALHSLRCDVDSALARHTENEKVHKRDLTQIGPLRRIGG